MNLSNYKNIFLNYLEKEIHVKEPKNLYEPIKYILNLGGKRLRPILTLLACDLFDEDAKSALSASLAIEVFHNFTLVHDDIMDQANLRRGKETVHAKWNENTGILSGDAMLIISSQLLEKYEGEIYKKLTSLFNKTALEVCEGQQYDIDFETRNDVNLSEYIKMITYKTAVLVACSLKMGAIIANAIPKDIEYIYDFGLNLGIAFQLQDDYLDTFGDEKTFGKKIGGDILENKKTYLYIYVLKNASKNDAAILVKLYSNNDKTTKKIQLVTDLFLKYKIKEIIKNEINNYTEKAFKCLEDTTLNAEKKELLQVLGNNLLNRTV